MDAELEDLWKDVRQNAKIPAKAEKRQSPEAPKGSLLTNPENWERRRGIALIHKETQTLLGNFSEYVHRTLPDARKLIREEAPISVSAVEEVEGSWWLGEGRKVEPKQVWHESRPAILHIYLEALACHAPACEVTAQVSYGGIARVELILDTMFSLTSGEGLIELPAGTNILDVMALDSKISLRKEIGL